MQTMFYKVKRQECQGCTAERWVEYDGDERIKVVRDPECPQ